jgi:hypothetical protein
MGMRASTSQCSPIRRRIPSPSEPITSTTGRPSSAVSNGVSLSPAKPTINQPRSVSLSSARGEIDHPRRRNLFDRPRRRLGQRPAELGRMAILQDDAPRPESRRRAEDGADVLRISHLVQHKQETRCGIGQIFQRHPLQRRGLDHHPLVRRAGRQIAGDLAVLQDLHGEVRMQHFQLGGAIRGGQHLGRRVAVRVRQRRLHSVPAPDPAGRVTRHRPPMAPASAAFMRAAKGRLAVVAFARRGHYKAPSDLGLTNLRTDWGLRIVALRFQRKAMGGGLFVSEGANGIGAEFSALTPTRFAGVWRGGRAVNGSRL